ncbi:MAG TPA: thioredoxin domain-containing protein [Solirubrobacteraceae bacterium]|nr:thioredoxin domain-containing protein [Solirubrobacteraceae bacterium]
MPNALAGETSPYLRQHQHNPVDWLPWSATALARARERNLPLLVSIGYSSCHWCHVMERESFEDERTAELMNRHFVCVKVDREERPDLDALYMEAVQSMTGHGGWPLNVFLTPEQLPFYGGTYFPPDGRHSMPAWTDVLQTIADTWAREHEQIRANSEQLRARLAGGALLAPSAEPLHARTLDAAVLALKPSYDERNGGFGAAPKFPPSSTLEFLLRRAAAHPLGARTQEARMALHTLAAMAHGGIHDQVGGGFHRYSVDATWTVPHFEKMLYDNALLARAYLHGFQLSGEPRLLDVCLDTLGWALREMRGPEGGFYSALDADSEGVEGRFYVWKLSELESVLGAAAGADAGGVAVGSTVVDAAAAGSDAAAAIAYFGATAQGNFLDESHPGQSDADRANVLEAHGPEPDAEQLRHVRQQLLAARERRMRPSLDDKRLTAWNALMITALAETGAYLRSAPVRDDANPANVSETGDRPSGETLIAAAVHCAEFVLRELRDEHGRLLRSYNEGRAKFDAYLEDHAFLLEALIALYEATFEERWFSEAVRLADQIITRFADPERGGFFSTASDHEQLIARRKDLEDAPIPAGASSAAAGLLRLAALTGEHEYERHAVGVLRLLHEVAPRHPTMFGHLLQALDFYVSPVREVALLGDEGRAPLETLLRSALRPHVVLAAGPGDGTPSAVALLAGRTPVDGRAAAYVCERFACQRPVTEPAQLAALLE